MNRPALVAVLILSVACARNPDVAATPAVLFTGAPCDGARVGTAFSIGWREVRGTAFTYCVPPEVVSRSGAGKYWESKSIRFSWGPDPRVDAGPDRVPFMIAGGHMTPLTDASDDYRKIELIDDKQAKVSVVRTDNYFRVECDFDAAGLKYRGRSGTSPANEVLLAVCRSVRFAP